MDQLDSYLTIEEVAARYRVEVSTVRHWRVIGVGPRGVHAHGRKGILIYPAAEIRRYDEELLQQAISERELRPGTAGRGTARARHLAPAPARTARS
jgi:hypothetical protein